MVVGYRSTGNRIVSYRIITGIKLWLAHGRRSNANAHSTTGDFKMYICPGNTRRKYSGLWLDLIGNRKLDRPQPSTISNAQRINIVAGWLLISRNQP